MKPTPSSSTSRPAGGSRRGRRAASPAAAGASHGGFRKSGGFFGALLEFVELMGPDFPASSPVIPASATRRRA
jgi:hypothetical protein